MAHPVAMLARCAEQLASCFATPWTMPPPDGVVDTCDMLYMGISELSAASCGREELRVLCSALLPLARNMAALEAQIFTALNSPAGSQFGSVGLMVLQCEACSHIGSLFLSDPIQRAVDLGLAHRDLQVQLASGLMLCAAPAVVARCAALLAASRAGGSGRQGTSSTGGTTGGTTGSHREAAVLARPLGGFLENLSEAGLALVPPHPCAFVTAALRSTAWRPLAVLQAARHAVHAVTYILPHKPVGDLESFAGKLAHRLFCREPAEWQGAEGGNELYAATRKMLLLMLERLIDAFPSQTAAPAVAGSQGSSGGSAAEAAAAGSSAGGAAAAGGGATAGRWEFASWGEAWAHAVEATYAASQAPLGRGFDQEESSRLAQLAVLAAERLAPPPGQHPATDAAFLAAAGAAELCMAAHMSQAKGALLRHQQRFPNGFPRTQAAVLILLEPLQALPALPPGLQLLRTLLSDQSAAAAAPRDALFWRGSPAGALLAAASAAQVCVGLLAAQVGNAEQLADVLAEPPAPASSAPQQAAVVGLMATAEATVRCLADAGSITAGMLRLQRWGAGSGQHASLLPSLGEAVGLLPALQQLTRGLGVCLTEMGRERCSQGRQAAEERWQQQQQQQPRPPVHEQPYDLAVVPAGQAGAEFEAARSLATTAFKAVHAAAAAGPVPLGSGDSMHPHATAITACNLHSWTLVTSFQQLPMHCQLEGPRLSQMLGALLAWRSTLEKVENVLSDPEDGQDQALRGLATLSYLWPLLQQPALRRALLRAGIAGDISAALAMVVARHAYVDDDVDLDSTVESLLEMCGPSLALTIASDAGFGRTLTAAAASSNSLPLQVEHLILSVHQSALSQLPPEQAAELHSITCNCGGSGQQPNADPNPHTTVRQLLPLRPYWTRLASLAGAQLAQRPLVAPAGTVGDEQAQLEQAQALGTRSCASLACSNLAGVSEAALPKGRRCSGCRTLRYCSVACSQAAWRGHKRACRVLARGGQGQQGQQQGQEQQEQEQEQGQGQNQGQEQAQQGVVG